MLVAVAMVAVAMVAAACGGGGATPSVDSTNPATPSKGNVVSPDGMLTVIPPAGAGDITIAEAGPIGIQSLEVATVWSFTRVPLSVDGASVVFENPAGELLDGRDRKSTRLNSSHTDISRMPSSA